MAPVILLTVFAYSLKVFNCLILFCYWAIEFISKPKPLKLKKRYADYDPICNYSYNKYFNNCNLVPIKKLIKI